jgi:CHASE1-domain containing sensor protein
MIKVYFSRFFVSALLFLLTAYGATWLISPQSLVNFVGPCAAIFSGLVLVWGWTPLVALIITSPFIVLILNVYFKLDASLAVVIIALLAITLQGVWTKQLVFRFIRYKKWLVSRKHLFFFLLRIGPLASLTAASAVLLISILDNRVTEGSFLYNFLHAWSATMLVSVFFIPLLLLVKNAEQLKLTKRVFVSFTSILGGIAILILLKTTQNEQQHHRQEFFDQSAAEIQRIIRDELDQVVNTVDSLSALFVASDSVSNNEFNEFSKSVLQKRPSIRVLEWAPIVTRSGRSAFENKHSSRLEQVFVIKERKADGTVTKAPERQSYAPLTYLYPLYNNKAALGLDVYSNPAHVLSMQEVVNNNGVVASGPISLLQDYKAQPAILFSKAIFVKDNFNKTKTEVTVAQLPKLKQQYLLGFVVAVVQFDDFFQSLALNYNKRVKFNVKDVTTTEPVTLFGEAETSHNRYVTIFNLPNFSRMWQIKVIERESWFSQTKSWQAWAILSGGTLAALLFQMLLLMMAAYSSELGHQVDTKTRALMLAKENIEKKSLAKSNFLKNLNNELSLPLLAIKSLVQQMKAKGINNNELTAINYAGSNISLLLDTMMDLSNIESGNVTIREVSFDFYGFLERIEAVLKAGSKYNSKSISFLIDESVPHYINSDELYIQKLLHSLIEGGHALLDTENLRISIKLHQHKLVEPSLFFTLSSQNHSLSELSKQAVNQQSGVDLAANNTAMAMAIKYSQLLNGNTNLGISLSGIRVLNSSIRVIISSKRQQEMHQGLTFDLDN